MNKNLREKPYLWAELWAVLAVCFVYKKQWFKAVHLYLYAFLGKGQKLGHLVRCLSEGLGMWGELGWGRNMWLNINAGAGMACGVCTTCWWPWQAPSTERASNEQVGMVCRALVCQPLSLSAQDAYTPVEIDVSSLNVQYGSKLGTPVGWGKCQGRYLFLSTGL